MHNCMGYFDLIKKYFFRHHFHFVLLLFFFCLNGYHNFRTLADPASFLSFFSFVFSIVLFFYFLLLRFLKNKQKSGLLTFYFLFIFLFFGNIEDVFAKIQWLVYLSEPRFFLPLLFIVSIVVVYKICTIRKTHNFHIFLNLVLFVWIVYEIVVMSWPISNQKHRSVIESRLNILTPENTIPVYWVILDEYAGDSVLLSDYEFNNTRFKDQMKSIGFGDIAKTKANYPLTVYSIASMLNMDYLPTAALHQNYAYGYKYALSALRDNGLVEIFSHWGYDIRNYSFFDFKKAPAYFSNSLWGGGVRAFTARCMHIRLYKHFFSFADKNHFGWFANYERSHNYKHIMDVLHETRKTITDSGRPSFNFIHFIAPHKPFLFDSVGGNLTMSSQMKDQKDFNKKAYIWSVQKMNQLMIDWSKDIIKKHKGKVVIMIMSDHGPAGKRYKGRSLDNLSIVYTPLRNYRGWYQGISNVNQGRVLLNQVFGQNIPLLKDSLYRLTIVNQSD